jgi:hypothetical protein
MSRKETLWWPFLVPDDVTKPGIDQINGSHMPMMPETTTPSYEIVNNSSKPMATP